MVDEYYCLETTTVQTCLGYVSLDHSRAAEYIHADEGQPETNVSCLLDLLCIRLFPCRQLGLRA